MDDFPSSESSSDDSSLDSAARRKKKELKDAAANWVAPTSTGVTNSEAIVQYDDLKTGKIYSEMEVIPAIVVVFLSPMISKHEVCTQL